MKVRNKISSTPIRIAKIKYIKAENQILGEKNAELEHPYNDVQNAK